MVSIADVESSLEIQREGVAAIERITSGFDTADWRRPTPCEGWTTTDLAGHVLTAINNWHVLLDDSEAGAPTARFAWADMDVFFLQRLAELPISSGPERIAQFVVRADEYFDRVAVLDSHLPLVSALSDVAARPVTVGLFAWVGGIEWHVHAWDFARSVGDEYRAADAASIHAAAAVLYGRSIGDEDPWDAIIDRLRPSRGAA